MSTDSPSAQKLASRLENARVELRALEDAIQGHDIEPRVLGEFRQALDHMRLTAWAIQKWLELKTQNRETASLVPLLMGERLRRATYLNQELRDDLNKIDVTRQTDGLADLYHSVEALLERLEPVFKRDRKRGSD